MEHSQSSLKKISYSITDQLFVAGTMFLLNIFLARIQDKQEYGNFVLSYSVYTFLLGLYNAMLLEPYYVFGPGKYQHSFNSYLRYMFKKQIIAGLFISGVLLVVLAVIFVAFPLHFSYSFLGMAFAVSLLFSGHFFRRTLYIRRDAKAAAFFSILFFINVVLGIYFLYKLNLLNGFSVFMVLGLSWALGLMVFIGKELSYSPQDNFIDANQGYWRSHWEYSRWVLLTAFIFQLTSQGYYWLISAFLSVSEVAELRAVQNMTSPIEHVSIALSLFSLPLLARYHSESCRAEFSKVLKRMLLLSLLVTIGYAGILWLAGKYILQMLYGERYVNTVILVLPLSLLPIIMGAGGCLNDSLKAMNKPQIVFYAYVMSGIVTLSVGILLVKRLGILGAAYGMVASAGTYGAILIIGYFYAVNRHNRFALANMRNNTNAE